MDNINKDAEGTPTGVLRLGYGFNFEDLYDHAGLARIDEAFLSHLAGELEGRFASDRNNRGASIICLNR